MKIVNTKDKELILSVEDNKILCARGDFALGYRLSYPEKYSIRDTDFDSIHSDWVRALQNLPVGTIVVKTDMYIKKGYDTSSFPTDTFLQKSIVNYFSGRPYFEHQALIFFVSSRLDTFKNESIKNPFVFPKLSEMKKEDNELELFIKEVESAVELLRKGEYLDITPLTESEVYKYQRFYFNGFQSDYLTDIKIKRKIVNADSMNIGIYALTNEKLFPNNIATVQRDNAFSSKNDDFVFYQGRMDNFSATLKCNHVYNQIIFIDNHKRHLEVLDRNVKDFGGASSFNSDNAKIRNDISKAITEAGENDFRFVRGHSNIIFWDEDINVFKQEKERISTLFKEEDFIPYYATGERLKNIFLNSFFANISCMDNNSLYLVNLQIACALFVNTGNYKNDKQGVYFNDRIYNIPVKYDFWDANKKYISSRNFQIIARTGRGKSFTANHIFRPLIEDGIIHVIIDLGDSYLKFSKLLPEDEVLIYKYKEGEPLGLNPFNLAGQKLVSLKVEELCVFVWTLIKQGKEPNELENTSMRKIITHYYNIEEENHSWEGFYRFVEANEVDIFKQLNLEKDFFNIKEFLHVGSNFVGNGIYAHLFKGNQDNSGSFDGKKLILFELGNIQENKLLLTIFLQAISEAIQKTIWLDRTKRGIVFFDEFAKQLEFPSVLSKVKYYFQAVRKYNGSCGIVLQTLNQLPENPDGKTIIDNTETYIFLRANSYKDEVERLDLKTHAHTLLSSIRNNFNGTPKYSEIGIIRNNHMNVYRIEEPPEVYYAYQTEGAEHERIMQLYDECHSMEKAITEYMRTKPLNN